MTDFHWTPQFILSSSQYWHLNGVKIEIFEEMGIKYWLNSVFTVDNELPELSKLCI